MLLIRTLAAWRLKLSDYLELQDKTADLDVMIWAIVDELAPELVLRTGVG